MLSLSTLFYKEVKIDLSLSVLFSLGRPFIYPPTAAKAAEKGETETRLGINRGAELCVQRSVNYEIVDERRLLVGGAGLLLLLLSFHY